MRAMATWPKGSLPNQPNVHHWRSARRLADSSGRGLALRGLTLFATAGRRSVDERRPDDRQARAGEWSQQVDPHHVEGSAHDCGPKRPSGIHRCPAERTPEQAVEDARPADGQRRIRPDELVAVRSTENDAD